MSRVFQMSVASIHALYVKKVEKKGRTRRRSTRSSAGSVASTRLLGAPGGRDHLRRLLPGGPDDPGPPHKGVVCKVRVEEVADPLIQKIRYLDLLVDELARGKELERILREPRS